MPDNPNPTFYALTISRQHVARVEKKIQSYLGEEKGGILKPIQLNKYVIVRSALKAMRPKHDSVPAMLDFLRKLPNVIQVQPLTGKQLRDQYAAGLLDPDDPEADADLPDDGIPQHLIFVKAKAAWDFLEEQGRADALTEIEVAHLDTGITRHPVFGRWKDGRTATIRPDLGINYIDRGGAPFDPVATNYAGQRGHGTKTASVLAGMAPRALYGMARGVTLIPYRVTNTSVIDTFADTPIDRALDHAWSANGCRVASVSLGDPCSPSPRTARAIEEAYRRGMIVVAAAGNVTAEVTFPGSHPCTVTAGGVNLDSTPWAGGSRGAMVDLCAPASSILRAETVVFDLKDKYAYGHQGDGTSYATALVAGAAALWLARWGADALDAKYGGWRTVEAFRAAVKGAARKPQGWNSNKFGAGILDAEALLRAGLPDPATLKPRLA